MSKVQPIETIAAAVAEHRRDGANIVLCHGCFDLLHIGHIQHLEAARTLGNILVVTVTADPFVHKGQGRPHFSHAMRADAIAALACVDYVAVNFAETAADAIRLIRPNHFVKGVEFKGIEDEKAALAEYGGKMEYLSGNVVSSSTKLLAGAR